MNRWSIPDWLEEEVKKRDKTCVYCGVEMIEHMPPHGSRRAAATWEHIVNDARIVTRENIARCCAACNSSKGTKDLSVGFSPAIAGSEESAKTQLQKW